MKTFRQLVASERPLVLPGAHDAISARLIQRAGFKAYFIGGFPLVGARFGLPDIGLLALGERDWLGHSRHHGILRSARIGRLR